MKRLSSAPCQEWSEKLLASHTDAPSLSEYLVLKEHLLTCPACAEAHNRYLSVEIQIRNLPVLQPKRQFAAELLAAEDIRRRAVRSSARQRRTSRLYEIEVLQRYALATACYRTLSSLASQMRKPVYAFVALLFCILATAAGAGTIQYALHSDPQAHPAKLAVSTTGLALSLTTRASSNAQFAQSERAQQLLFATGTFRINNTGEHTLMWNVDIAKSVVVYMPGTVKLWTNPSHGTVGSNKYSTVQVMAGGVVFDAPPPKHDLELGSIMLTSNGGDAAIHTVVKSTVSSAQKFPQHLLDTKQVTMLSTSPVYMFRKQEFWGM